MTGGARSFIGLKWSGLDRPGVVADVDLGPGFGASEVAQAFAEGAQEFLMVRVEGKVGPEEGDGRSLFHDREGVDHRACVGSDGNVVARMSLCDGREME